MIKAVIFDFGGVLAEEGFKLGLKAIAEKNGRNPEDFFATAEELIYQTGYVTGTAEESDYWNALRGKTGITTGDGELREEVLKRFVLRQEMLDYIETLRSSCIVTALLSDQTNWLDEINQKTPFYHHFYYVFNSFKLKKGKRDQSIFSDVCLSLGFKPSEAVFVDDNEHNIKRASSEGLNVIHFKSFSGLANELAGHIPYILSPQS